MQAPVLVGAQQRRHVLQCVVLLIDKGIVQLLSLAGGIGGNALEQAVQSVSTHVGLAQQLHAPQRDGGRHILCRLCQQLFHLRRLLRAVEPGGGVVLHIRQQLRPGSGCAGQHPLELRLAVGQERLRLPGGGGQLHPPQIGQQDIVIHGALRRAVDGEAGVGGRDALGDQGAGGGGLIPAAAGGRHIRRKDRYPHSVLGGGAKRLRHAPEPVGRRALSVGDAARLPVADQAAAGRPSGAASGGDGAAVVQVGQRRKAGVAAVLHGADPPGDAARAAGVAAAAADAAVVDRVGHHHVQLIGKMAVLVETARDAAHTDGAGDGGAVLTLPKLRPAGEKSRDAAHAAQARHRPLAAAIAHHGVLPHRTGDAAGVGQLAGQRAEAHTAVHDAAAAYLPHDAAHMDGRALTGVGDMHRRLTAINHAGAAARNAAGGAVEDAVAAAVRLVANDAARQPDGADHTAVRHGAEQAGIAALCGGIGGRQAVDDEAAAVKRTAVAAGGVHTGGSADGRPRHIAEIQRLRDTGAQGGAALVDPVREPRQLRAGGDEERLGVRADTGGAASRSAVPSFIRRNAIAADGVFHTGGGLLHGRAAFRRMALYFVYVPGSGQRRQCLAALTLQPGGDFSRRLPRRIVQLVPEAGASRHLRQARLHTGNGGGKGVLHLSGGGLPGSRQTLLIRQRLFPAEQRPSLLRRQQECAAVRQVVCTGVERRQQYLPAVRAVLCEQAGIRQVKGVVAAYGRGDPEAAAARQRAAVLHRAAESARHIGGHPPLRPPRGQRGAAISRRGG